MGWLYYNSNDNEYRYALGEVQENPSKLLFCFGINPSNATPEKLDPTASKILKIAKEHGYDSWIIINVSAQRATDPNVMLPTQDIIQHTKNLDTIKALIHTYCECSDILFAYGNLINKRDYLKKNLCEIISIIKSNQFSGNCYCLGKTKAGNARHPLYQKATAPFVPYSLDGHTYSEFVHLDNGKCVIQEFSESGTLLMETVGTCN